MTKGLKMSRLSTSITLKNIMNLDSMMYIMRHWDTLHYRLIFLYVRGNFIFVLFLCLYLGIQKVNTLRHVNGKYYLYII